MLFAVRVAVGSAIMIGFYLSTGFHSQLATFVMAFGAALAAQGAAFGVKMLVGDQPRTGRSIALLVAAVVAACACVAIAMTIS
jgi:hypothetical protein